MRLLAALSATTDFSVGCYCQDAERCHRALLRDLLIEHGALFADSPFGEGCAGSEMNRINAA
jgi:hypothetical protein